MDEHLWWYLARAGGLTAWWLLCIAVLWGLLLSTRILGDRTPPAWLLDLHRMLGGLAVVFTGLHMTGLFFDEWAGFGWSELLVPFSSEFKPGAVAWGVVAFHLLVAIEVTSLLKKRIPDGVWRWVHRCAFVVFVFATVHTFTTGTDGANRWIQGGAATVALGFLFLLVYRLSTGRRPREPRPPNPVATGVAPAPVPEPALVGVGAGPVADPTGAYGMQPVAQPVAAAPATGATAPSRARFHALTVREIIRETTDAVSVAFAVPKELAPEFRFEPGQHLTLRTHIGGDEIRRAYSLCSGVTDGELRIAVKRVEGGRASPWVNRELAVGEVVEVATPSGRFRTEINPLHERHLLGVAAGSGITPVLSILKSVLAVEPRSRFTLLYGNRDADSTIFRDKLALLQEKYGDRLRVVHVLSRCDKAEPRLRGRIDADKLRDLEDLLEIHTVDDAYLCGPREMTLGVRDALVERGLERERVHVELFGGPAPTSSATQTAPLPTTPGAPAARNVAVVDRGARTEVSVNPGETVLDAALRSGLDLPYSCRDGVCGTCRAKLACGRINQDNADLSPAEIAAGYVLTCQARPESEGVVISVDEG
jgi:ferredoxin-NADP reductase/DMSO/TMAO reductase YedYZ heme-binding membrane subunit